MNQPFTSFQDFKRRYPIRPNDDGALLGSGSYGRVIKVEDQLETEWVAVKISEYKGNDTKSLKAEVELAQRVPRQANIARYDACYRLETDTSVSDFAIMKYYPDGNLADLLRNVVLTPAQVYDITRGILLGLQHLHRHHIVHRDFKPANILISRDNAGRFIPKIADFGLSKLVSDDELDSSDFDLSDGRGTPSYKAPEQIEGTRVSFNLDLWAFGVILYEILTGEKPFRVDSRNSTEQSARREIEKKIITVELPSRLDQLEEPYRTIIRRCLVRDIHERVRKEDELLDLLDTIPQLLNEAKKRLSQEKYEEALPLFEQLLAKREHHTEAQKGLEQCKLSIQNKQIARLLNEANTLLNQQQVEQAKATYEQVLRMLPDQAEATRGLALCIDRLRPKPFSPGPELTDVYQEERTDVYADFVESKPLSTVHKETFAAEKKLVKSPFVKSAPALEAVTGQNTRTFPWKVVAPIALGLGAVGLYFNLNHAPSRDQSSPTDSLATAAVGLPVKPKSLGATAEMKSATVPISNTSKALDKRVDGILNTAKQAYRKRDYVNVVALTNNALQLDPGRQDILILRNEARKALNQPLAETTKEASSSPTDVPTPTVESARQMAVESTPKDNLAGSKKEAQDKYDQLIDEGINAIAKGNNKAKAIASFTAARSLAKDSDINTSKADGAYNLYMAKANKIFDRDEYEGAREWYKVAQSLRDTHEVQIKINQCNNQ